MAASSSIPHRRAFLRAALSCSALVGVGALVACTASTSGGVTTWTINTAEVTTDVEVAIAVIKTALGFTGIPSAVVTTVDTILSTVTTALQAFEKEAGSSTTLTFDSSDIPSALSSLISDLQTAASDISATASSLSSALAAKISAIATDVDSVAAILASMISAVTSARVGLTAAQARAAQIQAIEERHGVAL